MLYRRYPAPLTRIPGVAVPAKARTAARPAVSPGLLSKVRSGREVRIGSIPRQRGSPWLLPPDSHAPRPLRRQDVGQLDVEYFGQRDEGPESRVSGHAGVGLALLELAVGKRRDVRGDRQALLAEAPSGAQAVQTDAELPGVALPRVCGCAGGLIMKQLTENVNTSSGPDRP